MYKIQLYDGNCNPLCDWVVVFYLDDLEEFEKNWIPLIGSDSVQVKKYFESKSGKMVTDYWSNSPDLNIIQKKNINIIAEKSYTEKDVMKKVENIYGFSSKYHMDSITYHIRYVHNIDENIWFKLCCFEIRGICYDTGESYWIGENTEKYEAMGFEACRHLINENYLPAYHIFEDGKRMAVYHPRYSYVHVYGNPFISLKNDVHLFSDHISDYKDVEANLFVWYVVKVFDNETKFKNNIRHYKLGKDETQCLLQDFPGESG